ncbi:uncharacterized protein N7529_001608 [Penicillium soppii]|jgi:hypothetical protein|uniref:uncharacterized protein n=1 Tax=Penicillium soppii TaxID=69789 RepID=UPI0025482855|nr:uncharacterized protein N7529_001608 [Penicillium soppii]KAJ5876024.1 hypothetical protein N7529_001608 [Penicillium soppii]
MASQAARASVNIWDQGAHLQSGYGLDAELGLFKEEDEENQINGYKNSTPPVYPWPSLAISDISGGDWSEKDL